MGERAAAAVSRARLQALEAATPELCDRLELADKLNELAVQRHAQQRVLAQARRDAERQARRIDELEALLAKREAACADTPAVIEPSAAMAPGTTATPRAVLCVGGRVASVPVYRRLVEDRGDRFLHHDGGEEDNPAKLDATLAAADAVICQTGCISHDAYWRVKDHCKRTGKRCVFVDSPSRTGLVRALSELVSSAS